MALCPQEGLREVGRAVAGPAHPMWSVSLCLTAAAKFFSASCVPCADEQRYPNLCRLCAGTGGNKCACSSKEPYFGYSGAFK